MYSKYTFVRNNSDISNIFIMGDTVYLADFTLFNYSIEQRAYNSLQHG